MACAWENKQRAVEICGGGFWQVNTATYNGAAREFYVGSEDAGPEGIFFKPDGTRMFIVGGNNRTIIEYDLTTPWQVNTATYNGAAREFYVGSEDTVPDGIFFKPDGTRMFIVGSTDDAIVEYDLTTPWQVNTATYNGAAREFYVGSEDIHPEAVFFKPDGTRMFVIGEFSNVVVEYDLTTPWQVNTATYNGAARALSIGSEETTAQSIFFKPDGTRMFIVGSAGDAVVEYDLTTPWQVNTATYNGAAREFSVGSEDTAPTGLFFKPDGTRMFIVGLADDAVVEYDLAAV